MYYKELKHLVPLGLSGKIVLLRCDLNIPFDEQGRLLDDTRIAALIPTITFLIKHGAKIIVASHLGRPSGKYNDTLSLKKLIPYIEEYWGVSVKFVNDVFSKNISTYVKNACDRNIVLLENLRFYKGEENNDKQFAKHLSTFADIYINDAFASCHNKHASIDAITELLPSYPGLSLVSELQNLCAAWDVKKKPQTLIIGGKKISTKISVLRSLVNKVDNLIIAGAMANNFFKALGYEIGKSFYEAEFVQAAKELYYENQKKIILPTDFIVKEAQNKLFLKDISSICEEDCMLDIGLNSCEKICQILRKSKVIIWNGPIGVYENPQYAVSSLYIARAIAYLTKNKHLTSIIGGGDALAVAKISGLSHCFSYISTGGGAFLELLEKGDLSVLKNLRV